MKIAVASGKGGTGKTTISTNLAMYLSEMKEVVLVDLDVEEPNVSLFLNAELKTSEDKFKMIPKWEESCLLCGLCQELCNFNAVIQLGNKIMILPEICHSCYACSELCPDESLKMVPQKMGMLNVYKKQKLDFVESKMEIGQEQAVPLIVQTKKFISENFNSKAIRIFDSPPGTSCPVIETIKDCDLILLVTEPTPFGLHDLSIAVETAKQLDKQCAVIINKSDNNNLIENFCIEQKINIIAKIPNSKEIAELYSRGELLYNKVPIVLEELKKIVLYIDNFEPKVINE